MKAHELIREKWHVCPNHHSEVVDGHDVALLEMRRTVDERRRDQIALIAAHIPELIQIALDAADKGSDFARQVLMTTGLASNDNLNAWQKSA